MEFLDDLLFIEKRDNHANHGLAVGGWVAFLHDYVGLAEMEKSTTLTSTVIVLGRVLGGFFHFR